MTFSPGLLQAPVTLSASAGAVVLYRVDEGVLTVADPSQSQATVELDLSVGALGARPAGFGGAQRKTMSVSLPSGGAAGKSVSVQLA